MKKKCMLVNILVFIFIHLVNSVYYFVVRGNVDFVVLNFVVEAVCTVLISGLLVASAEKKMFCDKSLIRNKTALVSMLLMVLIFIASLVFHWLLGLLAPKSSELYFCMYSSTGILVPWVAILITMFFRYRLVSANKIAQRIFAVVGVVVFVIFFILLYDSYSVICYATGPDGGGWGAYFAVSYALIIIGFAERVCELIVGTLTILSLSLIKTKE